MKFISSLCCPMWLMPRCLFSQSRTSCESEIVCCNIFRISQEISHFYHRLVVLTFFVEKSKWYKMAVERIQVFLNLAGSTYNLSHCRWSQQSRFRCRKEAVFSFPCVICTLSWFKLNYFQNNWNMRKLVTSRVNSARLLL